MDVVSDAKKFAQPALDPDSVLTFLRLCLGRSLSGKLKSEVAFQQCVPLLPFFFQMHLTALNTSLERCMVPLFIEQEFHETESRDYCPWPRTDDSPSNPLFDRLFSQKLHFLLGTLLCEVKPTTCFAVIRERFAIWLKVQLPRAAILDCSSFFPMIDLSLTLFRRLLQCLSCYSKGRIATNLFFFSFYIYIFFLNGSLTHDHASKRIVRLSNVIWSLECFSRTHGWNATPLSYVAIESNENWCLRGFIIVADDWYSWWKFSRYFMRRSLQCISYLLLYRLMN